MLRLDADVLNYFRHTGKRYKTRINSVLRAYMHAHDTKRQAVVHAMPPSGHSVQFPPARFRTIPCRVGQAYLGLLQFAFARASAIAASR